MIHPRKIVEISGWLERNGLPAGDYLLRVDPSGVNAESKGLRVDLEAALDLLCTENE